MSSLGLYAAKSGLVVQTLRRPVVAGDATAESVRIGFTATKKIGNAVVRNRSKRRLRALVFEVLPRYALKGHDYNFIARAPTSEMPFGQLKKEMADALRFLIRLENGEKKGE